MTRFFIAVLVWLIVAGNIRAQNVPRNGTGKESPVDDVAAERNARVADRYRAMLSANPVEGMALDRLWKYHEEHGSIPGLLNSYHRATEEPNAKADDLLIYGHLLKKTGRRDEAAKAYQTAAERDPANPLPKAALAEVAASQGEPERAATLYGEALKLVPERDRRRTDLLLKQGGALLAAGKTEAAAESWENIVALNPTDLAVRRQLAEVYENNGLPDRAVAHFEYIEAHAAPAERAAALRELARLQEARGQFDAARDALERGLTLTSRDNWLHGEMQLRLIRLYQRAGRVPELAARWRDAVTKAPRDLAGYFQLVALAEAEGDAAGEMEAREKIALLAPNDRENNLRLAARFANAGELPRAAELYDRMLKAQPGNLDLIVARAYLDVQFGKLTEASGRMEERVAQSPADESVSTVALNFFLGHHLDAPAERILRTGIAKLPTATEPALALAKFLFARRRPEEAGAVLKTMTSLSSGDSKAAADRYNQAAGVYKEGGAVDEAIRCWEQAAKLQPADPAPLLAVAESERARGDSEAAIRTLRRATSLSTEGIDRIDVDRKLFEVLRGDEAPEKVDVSQRTGLVVRQDAGPLVNPASALGKFLAELGEKARAEPTVGSYLRLGRWYGWLHDGPTALEAANAVLTIDPKNIPAREMIAAVAVEMHHDELAEKMLIETLALDPARESAVLRQLAKLKLQAGENDEALRLFARLQELDPASRSALTDLAVAQQRMDRWYDAVATWERIYALPGSTAAQRTDARRPLLAAYEHVGQAAKAVEILLGAIDEQTDLSAKEDLLRQLSEMASQHEMGTELRGKFEERLRRRPDDYFTLTALAEFQRVEGEPEEAYRLLRRAYYNAPDPARALPVLVQEGRALGEIDDAVANQNRLVALPGQFNAENLQTLAELQEESQDTEATLRTWNIVAARFPREPGALGKASQYFERIGQTVRARDLQRQVVALDDSDLQRTLRLASLESRVGDNEAAVRAYDAVLARTAPEAPGAPLFPPDELVLPANPMLAPFAGVARARLRTSSGAFTVPPATKPPTSDRLLRLQAIREISRLRFAEKNEASPALAEARTAWLARWQSAANAGIRSEPLQAFYQAGQGTATMGLLAKLLADGKTDGAVVRGAFVAAGLRLGEFQTVGNWAWLQGESGERDLRVSTLIGALDQFLGTGGKPSPGMVAGLFPSGITRDDLLWETAKEFAALHWYAQASELGQRLLRRDSNNPAAYASEVTEWELSAGSVEGARETAKLALERGRGWSFEVTVSPVFAMLRTYYLLLPEAKRPAFVAEYLRKLTAPGEKVHATLAAILLHGLAGDEAEARRNLDVLLARHVMSSEEDAPSVDGRRWSYLLSNGLQLQNWGLDGLAVYLWRQALKDATAFDEHFGDGESKVTEIRRRLLCAEVALATDPEEARERVMDFLHTVPPAGSAAGLAGELMNSARYAAALQIDEYLCRIQPNEAEHWRSLCAVCERMGDYDRQEQILEGLLTGKSVFSEAMMRSDFVCRWATVRERNGDREGACRVLDTERNNSPGNLPVLVQLAQMLGRAEKYEQAAEVWREMLPLSPGPVAVLGLADAQEKQGRHAEAVKLLQSAQNAQAPNGQSEVAVRLAAVYLADGKLEDARGLAKSLLKEGRFEPLAGIAANFATAGQSAAAPEFLVAALGRTRDPGVRFRLQQALVGITPASGKNRRMFLREMARLETAVRENPALRGNWEAIRYKVARQAGADDWLETELRRLWNGGKGDYLAGERLATFYIDTHQNERLRDTIVEFDHRPMLPDQLLFGLETALLRADQAAFVIPIAERLCRRFPQNTDFALGRAAVLWKAGQREAATGVLDTILAQAVVHDELTERVALFYLSLGEKERAMHCFEQVVHSDPSAVRAPGNFLQLARLYIEAGRVQDAEPFLRVAYRQDACDDFQPLVDYLAASGQLSGDTAAKMPLPDFPLSFQRRAALLSSVYGQLRKAGRADAARLLWTRHPEFLAGAASTAAQLAHETPTEHLGEITAALRVAVNEFAVPLPRLARALAEAESRQKVPGNAVVAKPAVEGVSAAD